MLFLRIRSNTQKPQPKTPKTSYLCPIVLSFFRNNQAAAAIFLALYCALLRLPALAGWIEAPAAEVSTSGWVYRILFGWVANYPYISVGLAAVLVFIQAITLHYVADETRLMRERNWFPAAFYLLVASSLGDMLFLSPPLVAATTMPLVLQRVFAAYRQPKATALIFDAAFWIVVGSLFYPPMFWLLIAAAAGILALRTFNLNEQLVYTIGAATPLFLGWVLCFWFDQGAAFWQQQFVSLFRWSIVAPSMTLANLLKIGLIGLLLLIVGLSYWTYIRRRPMQIQKYIAALYWFLILGALSALLRREPGHAALFVVAAPIGLLLALSFQQMRNRFIAEMLHLALIGGFIFIHFVR